MSLGPICPQGQLASRRAAAFFRLWPTCATPSKTWGENRAGMPSRPGFRCPPPRRAGLRPPRFWTVSCSMRPSERWGVRRLGGTGVVPSVQRLHGLVRRCRSRQQFEPSTSCALPVATSASADARPSGDEAAIARRFPSALSILAPHRDAPPRSRRSVPTARPRTSQDHARV